MAFDAFVKIDGIPGESQDSKHKEWIEIDSFAHGLSQPTSATRSDRGGGGVERVDHQDFSIIKKIDKASPLLALNCCNGKHIPTVMISLCRAGGDKVQYMEYKMEDVVVSGLRPHGVAKGGNDTLPEEEVTFNYGKITWTYTQQTPQGTPGGNVAAGWNLQNNAQM